MWTYWFSSIGLPDGNSWITPVITGLLNASCCWGFCISHLSSVVPCIVCIVSACLRLSRRRGVFLFLACALLLPGVCAGPSSPRTGIVGRGPVTPISRTHIAGLERPIATPCRNRPRWDRLGDFSVGPTLLQQSQARADCHAFFEARVLLETLIEHFLDKGDTSKDDTTHDSCAEGLPGVDASPQPPADCAASCGDQGVAQPGRTACLPVLRLSEHLPTCPMHDLTRVGMNLPFGLDDVQRILCATWTLPSVLPLGLLFTLPLPRLSLHVGPSTRSHLVRLSTVRFLPMVLLSVGIVPGHL